MVTQVRSAAGVHLVPIQTVHLDKRRIFIEGQITMESACDFANQVMLLCDGSQEPIHVFIDSPGGEVKAGLMMYDIIQSCPAPMRMYCRGTAYSMAALLFASGCHGRYMLPNSELMLHEPLLSGGVQGSASSIKSISEGILAVRAKLNAILAKHTGKNVEQIEKATGYDHYFSAEESLAFGLADGIVGYDRMMGGDCNDAR